MTYPSPGAGSYSGSRSVSLYCYDTQGSCGATYYCLGTGCSPVLPYTDPITISASTVLRFYSRDFFGNSEAVKTIGYIISPDTTPPTTTAQLPTGTYRPVSAYLFCNDEIGSGCAATYYCLGSGCTPSTLYNHNSVNISSSTDFRYYSLDRDGNSETVKTVSYTIDATPPTTTATPGGGTYSSPQSVAISCDDGQAAAVRPPITAWETIARPTPRTAAPLILPPRPS